MPRYVPAGGGGAGVYIDWCITPVSSVVRDALPTINLNEQEASISFTTETSDSKGAGNHYFEKSNGAIFIKFC